MINSLYFLFVNCYHYWKIECEEKVTGEIVHQVGAQTTWLKTG